MTEQHNEVSVDAVNEQELGTKNRKPMVKRCFKEKDSNLPICGVHNVPLIRRETPIDSLAPRLGRISCLICPTSELVVHDSDENRPRDRT